jgi:hypothetical protein
MMLLVLVIGGWLGWKINRARTQAKAVSAIEIRHGRGDTDARVTYDYTFASEQDLFHESLYPKWLNYEAEPRAPKWLRKWVGDDYFREVWMVDVDAHNPPAKIWPEIAKLDHLLRLEINVHTTRLRGVTGLRSLNRLKYVEFRAGSMDDESLNEIASIPNLEHFHAESADLNDDDLRTLTQARKLVDVVLECNDVRFITEAGLVHLTKLDHLRSLELGSLAIKFSDKSLRELAPILPNLESLSLTPATITDGGILLLKPCARLKKLKIWSRALTDDCLVSVANLDTLEELHLSSAEFSDAGLSELRRLVHLRKIYLDGAKITHVGLAALAELKDLELIFLSNSRLTDSELSPIRRMKNLKNFWLNDDEDRISTEAIEGLIADMPSLQINVNGTKRNPSERANGSYY